MLLVVATAACSTVEPKVFDKVNSHQAARLCSASTVFVGRTNTGVDTFRNEHGQIFSRVPMTVLAGMRGVLDGSEESVVTLGGTLPDASSSWDGGIKPDAGVTYLVALGTPLRSYPDGFRKFHHTHRIQPAIGTYDGDTLRLEFEALCQAGALEP